MTPLKSAKEVIEAIEEAGRGYDLSTVPVYTEIRSPGKEYPDEFPFLEEAAADGEGGIALRLSNEECEI